MLAVRPALASDAKAMLDIYAPYVLQTAISFETQVPTVEEFTSRIENGMDRFPWIVSVVDGKIAAYVYASKHREREAYQWTCECSVYVHENFKGNGIGMELYGLLFQLLKILGFRNVYAGITLPNHASVRLHEKCGFIFFAEYERIGFKLDQWHNVGWWRLQLNDYELKPAPPLKFSQLDRSLFSDLFLKTAQRIQSKLTD